MRKIIVTAALGALMALGTAAPAFADHNGPWCQAEEFAPIAFARGDHDYCH